MIGHLDEVLSFPASGKGDRISEQFQNAVRVSLFKPNVSRACDSIKPVEPVIITRD